MTRLGGDRPFVRRSAAHIAEMLRRPEIVALVRDLDASRWTGRRGYGNRALVGACLVKAIYALPTWTWTVQLLGEHQALAEAIGGTPSAAACYRFSKKLRLNPAANAALQKCIQQLILGIQLELVRHHVQLGERVALDATDIPAYANGQRWLHDGGPAREKFADPDASWGHRSALGNRPAGSYYGYKLHAVVCSDSGVPVAWEVAPGSEQEGPKALSLLDVATRRGLRPQRATADKAYDARAIYEGCMDRGILPAIPVRMTADLEMYEGPRCKHGLWTFAGRDVKNRRTKWRCPTAECSPRSRWRPASRRTPLISRGSREYRRLLKGRAAVEREFARLKGQYGLITVRVRGLDRIRLHVDLTMLARLSSHLTLLVAEGQLSDAA